MLEEYIVNPCQFCGDEGTGVEKDELSEEGGVDIYFAFCVSCGARGPLETTKRKAATRFNGIMFSAVNMLDEAKENDVKNGKASKSIHDETTLLNKITIQHCDAINLEFVEGTLFIEQEHEQTANSLVAIPEDRVEYFLRAIRDLLFARLQKDS